MHDSRLGQILDALCAANLNGVFGAVARKALEVYAIPTPWLPQETTTIPLYGAYADEPKPPEAPRPASGQRKDGRDDLKPVLLSLGVSGDGGWPVRVGMRHGTPRESPETPVASEACLALGLDGVMGIVADRKADGTRTWGLSLEERVGLITLGATPLGDTAGTGSLGAAAARVASRGGATWTHEARDAATVARAKCHPAGGRGG